MTAFRTWGRLLTLTSLATVLALTASNASATRFARGHVFIARESTVGIQEYSGDGTLLGTFGIGHSEGYLCTSPNGKFLVEPSVGLFDNSGTLVASNWAIDEGGKCAVDGYGQVYVASGPAKREENGLGTGTFRKYDLTGHLLKTYTVPVHFRYGPYISAVDLGPNQCTVYYNTGGGPTIDTYDTCREASTEEGTGVTRNVDGIRVRPNGQIAVGEDYGSFVLSPFGEILRGFYPGYAGESYFGMVALDPDGTSFWLANGSPAGPYESGYGKFAWRYDLETGELLSSIKLPWETGVWGMAVDGTPGITPTIKKLSPKKGSASGGVPVTITGTGFTDVTSVKFGPTSPAESFTVNSPTSITATTPATVAGTADVTVTAGGSTSELSTKDRFKAGPPTITEVNPATGPATGGGTITISGTGFALNEGGTIIDFGTSAAILVNCTSTTACTAVVPSHNRGKVDIRAIVAGAKSKTTSGDRFQFE